MGAPAKKEESSGKEFQLTFEGSRTEMGNMQLSLLTNLQNFKYDEALKILEDFKEAKFSFPPFKRKTEKLFDLCTEHINAIKNKLDMPGFNNLLQSKQEELQQSALENWEHLKILLRRIRAIEKDFAAQDARSSLIVVKALMFSSIMVITVFLVKESFKYMGKSMGSFVKALIASLVEIMGA